MESSSTRRAKHDLISQRQQDMKMRAPIVSCVLEFGHVENRINDEFEI